MSILFGFFLLLLACKLLLNLCAPYLLLRSGASSSLGVPLFVDFVLWGAASLAARAIDTTEWGLSALEAATWLGLAVLATYMHYFVVLAGASLIGRTGADQTIGKKGLGKGGAPQQAEFQSALVRDVCELLSQFGFSTDPERIEAVSSGEVYFRWKVALERDSLEVYVYEDEAQFHWNDRLRPFEWQGYPNDPDRLAQEFLASLRRAIEGRRV